MVTSSPAGYVPNVPHPEVMRSILGGHWSTANT